MRAIPAGIPATRIWTGDVQQHLSGQTGGLYAEAAQFDVDEACTKGYGSRRHTRDHVHIGIGRCTGRHVMSGGVASLWPFGLFNTRRRSSRTWSKAVEPDTPPSSTRTTCAPDAPANCSAGIQ